MYGVAAALAGAPKRVRGVGAFLAPSLTQSTHWMPTAAGRWQSGQVGRPQRWQLT
jgi:alkylated DNA nucleotide flippase Atl1